jgi:arabinogalactan oligomer/maltooligosaccharide transport system permease protein
MDDHQGDRALPARSPSFSFRLIAKLAFLAAVNGAAVWALARLWEVEQWFGVGMLVVFTLAIDVVYLSRRAIPAKYLLPGTVLMLIFQVYPVLYSGYISFTNRGTGNILTKEQAIDQILRTATIARPDAPRYSMTVLVDPDGNLALLLTDGEGDQSLGTLDELVELRPGDVEGEGLQVRVDDYRALTIREAQDRQDEVLAIEVPTDNGIIRAQTFTTAAELEQTRRYDAATDTLTDIETDKAFHPVDGTFTADDGTTVSPGWQVIIGFDNYKRVFTSHAIRGPFVRVFLWTYAFALLSVAMTFALGLLLAIVLNHPAMRGRKVYRSLMVIPYALPSFMSALIWAGLLNRQFGAINDLLGADIPWLSDPWMAKVSVLLVNLWLGFPYMFLVSTGALQAIPSELKEAALVDGASPWQAFRGVTFPLVMVALAPLLISSFAFNFNNFNVIYLLNRGGPPIAGAETPAGHTDILISYTYRLAFEGGRGQDLGFATAISVLIFIMVATVSALSFRRTRALEEIR